MGKKLYFQKFEFKKSNYLLIIMLMFFFTFFLLVAIFGNGDKMFSLCLTIKVKQKTTGYAGKNSKTVVSQ